MGLMDKVARKALLDAGTERASNLLKGMRPSGLSQSEWDMMRSRLEVGNSQLKQEMLRDHASKNWEHGGFAHPTEWTVSPATSMDPHQVSVPIPFELRDKAMIYHSHPGDIVDLLNRTQPSPLSPMDLMATNIVRGNSALDSDGGYGIAIRNPRIKMAMGDMEELQGVASFAARKKIGERDPRVYLNNMDGETAGSGRLDAIAGTMGVGDALKRAKVFEEFDYLPGSERQIAELAKLAPAREAAAQAAEEKVRAFLKARGISEKDLAAIMGTLGTGALITMADEIQGGENGLAG